MDCEVGGGGLGEAKESGPTHHRKLEALGIETL